MLRRKLQEDRSQLAGLRAGTGGEEGDDERHALEVAREEDAVEAVDELLGPRPLLAAAVVPEVVDDELVEDLERVGLAELEPARVRCEVCRDEEEPSLVQVERDADACERERGRGRASQSRVPVEGRARSRRKREGRTALVAHPAAHQARRDPTRADALDEALAALGDEDGDVDAHQALLLDEDVRPASWPGRYRRRVVVLAAVILVRRRLGRRVRAPAAQVRLEPRRPALAVEALHLAGEDAARRRALLAADDDDVVRVALGERERRQAVVVVVAAAGERDGHRAAARAAAAVPALARQVLLGEVR